MATSSSSDGTSGPRAESPPPAGSPRSASLSLQAAAAMNAGLQREPAHQSSSSSLTRNMASPQVGQRRSNILMSLQLSDPSVPAPGEMLQEQPGSSPMTADPNHHRTPSLGELHQELEAEQEAHVNRLLQMIRQQQLELQRLQASQPLHTLGAAGDEGAAGSERLNHASPQPIATQYSAGQHVPSLSGSFSRSPVFPHHRGSIDLQRRSRTPSRGASPRLRSASISAESGDWALGGRDESSFYQAETQMLTRENQMLRHRVRELEKQVSELSTSPTAPNEPSVPSNLTRASMVADGKDGAASQLA